MFRKGQEGSDSRNERLRLIHTPKAGSYARRFFTLADLEKERQELEKRQVVEVERIKRNQSKKVTPPEKALQTPSRNSLDISSPTHDKSLERIRREAELGRHESELERVRSDALKNVTSPETVIQPS